MQLMFVPGDFEKRVTIPLINDRLREDSELFFVTCHSPVSSLSVELPNANSAIYVIDDDPGIGDLLHYHILDGVQ